MSMMSALPVSVMSQESAAAKDDPDRPTRPDFPKKDVTPHRPSDPNGQVDEDNNVNTGTKPGLWGELSPPIPVNILITREIADSLASIQNECANYDPIYRIDCLRQGIQLTLSRMPKTGEYLQARQILQKAASDLGRIVSDNADPNQPLLMAPKGANPHFKKHRQYTAIKRAKLGVAMKQAQGVIVEAETALLRSSENSERRQAHYQEISIAVGSTKVLLRSS